MSDDFYIRPDGENDETHIPQGLLEELDEALGESLSSDPLEGEPHNSCEEVPVGFSADPAIREMQETFLLMIRNALNPIARYMKAVALGENPRDLFEISELIVTPLISKIEEVGLKEHAEELSFFRSLLLLALGERDLSDLNPMKEVVMEGFIQLSSHFDLDCRGYRLAVKNLVEFYRAMRSSDGLSDVDIRRFFAIGVPSLTWVRRTKVADLTSLAGIDEDVMSQIRQLAFNYRSFVHSRSSRLARDDARAPRPRRTRVFSHEDRGFEQPFEAQAAPDEHIRGQA